MVCATTTSNIFFFFSKEDLKVGMRSPAEASDVAKQNMLQNSCICIGAVRPDQAPGQGHVTRPCVESSVAQIVSSTLSGIP